MDKILTIILMLYACSSFSQGRMSIVLGGGFDNDVVEATLNKKVIFKDTVTTNNLLGFADDFDLDRGLKDSVVVYIKIDNKNHKITLNTDYNYFLVEYKRHTHNINITPSVEPFMFE